MAQGTESDALELERVEFSRALNEANEEVDREIQTLHREMAAAGSFNSGARGFREMEIRFSKATLAIEKAIAKRKELGHKHPGLFTPHRLDQLRDRLDQYVDSLVQGHKMRMAVGGRGGGVASTVVSMDTKARGLKGKLNQALVALRLEARLGMHVEAKKESPMTFNISNSTIARLNLGNVFGDLTASVQTLSGYGQKGFAEMVPTVTEAIIASTEVQGEYKKEMLEHLSLVSTEAALPVEKRKLGPLKGSISLLADERFTSFRRSEFQRETA